MKQKNKKSNSKDKKDMHKEDYAGHINKIMQNKKSQKRI